MNKPKAHDNAEVASLLVGFLTAFELCVEHPAIDNILSGVLELKTPGSTATRALSRRVVFNILQQCPTISVSSVDLATGGRYAEASLRAYAAAARVASKAIQASITKRPVRAGLGEARHRLDAPFQLALQERIQNANLVKREPPDALRIL